MDGVCLSQLSDACGFMVMIVLHLRINEWIWLNEYGWAVIEQNDASTDGCVTNKPGETTNQLFDSVLLVMVS